MGMLSRLHAQRLGEFVGISCSCQVDGRVSLHPYGPGSEIWCSHHRSSPRCAFTYVYIVAQDAVAMGSINEGKFVCVCV